MIETLKYIIGDATQPLGNDNKIICHICNDIGGWGSGFVVAISNRWKLPQIEYSKWINSIQLNDRLGKVQFVNVEPNITIANMIAQRDVLWINNTPPIRYDAIRKCLKIVAEEARITNSSIHCPRFGAGLAGGDWKIIEKIIIDELTSLGISVTIYDLENPVDQTDLINKRKGNVNV